MRVENRPGPVEPAKNANKNKNEHIKINYDKDAKYCFLLFFYTHSKLVGIRTNVHFSQHSTAQLHLADLNASNNFYSQLHLAVMLKNWKAFVRLLFFSISYLFTFHITISVPFWISTVRVWLCECASVDVIVRCMHEYVFLSSFYLHWNVYSTLIASHHSKTMDNK